MTDHKASDELLQQTQPTLCVGGCGFFGCVTSPCPISAGIWSTSDNARAPAFPTGRLRDADLTKLPCSPLFGLFFPRAAATANMCSVCYKLHVNKKSKPEPQASPKATVEIVNKDVAASVPVVVKEAEGVPESKPEEAVGAATETKEMDIDGGDKDGGKPVQVNHNRCFSCNKRVGFTGFKCRCEYTFCSTHRHSNKHDCTFDYKALGRDAVAKANPAVVKDKIDKI